MVEIDVLPASSDSKGADAILVRLEKASSTGFTENQKILLIDGGYADNAERIEKHVIEIYKSNRIDCVVCTHPDSDHINGLVALLESNKLQIKNICAHDPWQHAYLISRKVRDERVTTKSVESRLDESLASLDELLTIAEKRGIKLWNPFAGFKIYEAITVLGPTKEYYCQLVKQYPGMHEERALTGDEEWVETKYDPNKGHFYENPLTSARNDSSMVLFLDFEGFRVIFSGDCGVEGFEKALAYANAEHLNVQGVDYYQLPHHGSIKNINPQIIDSICPKKVFVSAPSSSNKHPSRHIINYFTKHKGTSVYHVSTRTIKFSHNAPNRDGWTAVQPVPIFDTVFIPK